MKKLLLVLLLVTAAATFQANSQTYFDPTTVYLVDYNPKSSVMVFRGNTPLCAPTQQNQQPVVDFSSLDEAFKDQFSLQVPLAQGTFPVNYNLVIISLLNQDPEDTNDRFPDEQNSFNSPPAVPSPFPATPRTTWPYVIPETSAAPGITLPSSMGGISLYLWPINPSGTLISSQYVYPPSLLNSNKKGDVYAGDVAEFGLSLTRLVSSASKNTIFYIHCTSGRDRTGMAACVYLYYKYYITWLLTRKSQCLGHVNIPNQDIIDAIIIFGTTVRGDFSSVQNNYTQFNTPLNDLYTGDSLPKLPSSVNFARLYPGPGGALNYFLTIETIIGFIDPNSAIPSGYPINQKKGILPQHWLPLVNYFPRTTPPPPNCWWATNNPQSMQKGIGIIVNKEAAYPWTYSPPIPLPPTQPPPPRRKR